MLEQWAQCQRLVQSGKWSQQIDLQAVHAFCAVLIWITDGQNVSLDIQTILSSNQKYFFAIKRQPFIKGNAIFVIH